jgi:ABC-type enterochelin transport system ATPase subunit
VQKYGKKEAEDISSIITEVAPSLIKKNGSIKTTLPSIKKRVSLKTKVRVPVKGVDLNQKKKLGGKY